MHTCHTLRHMHAHTRTHARTYTHGLCFPAGRVCLCVAATMPPPLRIYQPRGKKCLALSLPQWGPQQQQNFASGNKMEIQSLGHNEKSAHKVFSFGEAKQA